MLKLLGSVCILGGSVLAVWQQLRERRRRQEVLADLIAALRQMAEEIRLVRTPLPQLLEQAGNGVYINSLSGLHAGANAISGDFSLQSAGFLIENGKKTVPVKSFTVAGNFYDLLKNVVCVADDCQLPAAMGMTAFGAPTVLVNGLSIAGK